MHAISGGRSVANMDKTSWKRGGGEDDRDKGLADLFIP